MTEMRDSYYCRILVPPNAPPPPLTPKYYLNDREGGRHCFWRPPMTPPPQTPQYLIILQTERGRALPLVGFCAPQCPPPSPDATILNYLNDREGGAIILCRTLPPPPSPDATILNDLNDSERGWGRQYPVRS